MLSERLLLALRLFCQRQGPLDHQTGSILQRSGHLFGQQREWPTVIHVRIVALLSYKSQAATPTNQMQSDRHSRLGWIEQFASHLQSDLWHHFCCPHRHVLDFPAACPVLASAFPSQHTEKPFHGLPPFLRFSTDAREKEAQATVEIKRLELKWGHPEEQHLCPRPCVLKY